MYEYIILTFFLVQRLISLVSEDIRNFLCARSLRADCLLIKKYQPFRPPGILIFQVPPIPAGSDNPISFTSAAPRSFSRVAAADNDRYIIRKTELSYEPVALSLIYRTIAASHISVSLLTMPMIAHYHIYVNNICAFYLPVNNIHDNKYTNGLFLGVPTIYTFTIYFSHRDREPCVTSCLFSSLPCQRCIAGFCYYRKKSGRFPCRLMYASILHSICMKSKNAQYNFLYISAVRTSPDLRHDSSHEPAHTGFVFDTQLSFCIQYNLT